MAVDRCRRELHSYRYRRKKILISSVVNLFSS